MRGKTTSSVRTAKPLSTNRTIMGEQTNGWLANGVGIVTALTMGAAAIAMGVAYFWH